MLHKHTRMWGEGAIQYCYATGEFSAAKEMFSGILANLGRVGGWISPEPQVWYGLNGLNHLSGTGGGYTSNRIHINHRPVLPLPVIPPQLIQTLIHLPPHLHRTL